MTGIFKILNVLFLGSFAVVYAKGQTQRNISFDIDRDSTFKVATDTTLYLNIGGTLDRDNTAGEKVSYRWDLYRYYKPGFEPLKSFTIKNAGLRQTDSIAFVFNDKGHWQTLSSIAAEVSKGFTSQKEKALGLWKFIADNHVYFYKPEDILSAECQDPLKFLAVYGYGDCFTMSNAIKLMNAVENKDSLWIWGLDAGAHGFAEVKTDSGFAVLDADEQAFYLKLDNKTLASYDDLKMDQYLYIRTKRYTQLYPFYSPYNYTDYKNIVSPYNYKAVFSEYGASGYSSLISLKPNESISFYYDSAKKYHQVALEGIENLPAETNILSFIGRGKQEYAPTSAQLASVSLHYRNDYYSVIKLVCPFVLTGGLLKATLNIPLGNQAFIMTYSEDLVTWKEIYSTTGTGLKDVTILLDTLIKPLVKPAVYRVYIKLNFSNPGALNFAAAVDSFNISADFQVSKFFLPRLKIGDNNIRITSDNKVGKKLEVSFNWKENSSNRQPLISADPVFPENAASVDSTDFTFKWQPATDPDNDGIKDYHFQLSDDSLMRFPLVSNFDIDISSFDSLVNPQYKSTIKDFLNDGKAYYWRVRALDSRGAWSNWSPTWSFTPHGPMQPKDLTYDTTTTGFILKWKPNSEGNKAAAYNVLASNSRGFYPTDATIIATVTDTFFTIDYTQKAYKYYRVSAQDALNNQSTATNYITVPDVLELKIENSINLDSVSDNNYPLAYRVDNNAPAIINNKKIATTKNTGKFFLYIDYINDRNETIQTDKQLVNVSKTKLYFTPAGNSKIYGEPNPEINWAITGFENNDTVDSIDVLPKMKFDITDFSPAATYPVYFDRGSDDHYELVSDTAKFTIEKRLLNVIADTLSAGYKNEIPPLTYHITGFAGNEGLSVIDVLPVLTTTAIKGSLPGAYEINISGGQDNNYYFNYTPAVLNINAEIPLVIPNPSNGVFTMYFKPEFAGMQLQIINSYGQRMGIMNINNTVMKFNFSGYAPGIFFLKIIDLKKNVLLSQSKVLIIK